MVAYMYDLKSFNPLHGQRWGTYLSISTKSRKRWNCAYVYILNLTGEPGYSEKIDLLENPFFKVSEIERGALNSQLQKL